MFVWMLGADQPQKHSMTVNWLLNDKPLDPVEKMALSVLDHLLLGININLISYIYIFIYTV